MAMYNDIPDHRYRFVDLVGDAFVVGAGCGSTFHFVKGFRSSPAKGGGGRLAAAVRAVCTNTPRVSGSFGAAMAVICALESAVSLARQREDHWNSILAGTASYGLLSVRRGASAAALSALYGATFFTGLAGAYLAAESWHGRLLASGREWRIKDGLPALVPIRRISIPPCPAPAVAVVHGDPASAGTVE